MSEAPSVILLPPPALGFGTVTSIEDGVVVVTFDDSDINQDVRGKQMRFASDGIGGGHLVVGSSITITSRSPRWDGGKQAWILDGASAKIVTQQMDSAKTDDHLNIAGAETEGVGWVSYPVPLTDDPDDLNPPDDYLRIGYVVFRLDNPVEAIKVERASPMESIQTLRSRSPVQRYSRHMTRRVTIALTFTTIQSINRTLLPLVRLFKRVPFLPVINNRLYNEGITALALSSFRISTMPGFPGALSAEIVCYEFNTTPYLLGCANDVALDALFCYPLLKIWAEKPLDPKTRGKYTPQFEPLGSPWNGAFQLYHISQDWLDQSIAYQEGSSAALLKHDVDLAATALAWDQQPDPLPVGYKQSNPNDGIGRLRPDEAPDIRNDFIAHGDRTVDGYRTLKDVYEASGHPLQGPEASSPAVTDWRDRGIIMLRVYTREAALTLLSNTYAEHGINHFSVWKSGVEVDDKAFKRLVENNDPTTIDGLRFGLYQIKIPRGCPALQTLAHRQVTLPVPPSDSERIDRQDPGCPPEMFVEQITASVENILAPLQVRNHLAPTYQYLGSTATYYVVTGTITSAPAVSQVVDFLNTVNRLAQAYPKQDFFGGLAVAECEIFQFLGTKSVIPVAFTTDTLEGFPNTLHFEMVLVEFDPTQRRTEEFNAITKGIEEFQVDSLGAGPQDVRAHMTSVTDSPSRRYLNQSELARRMRAVEIYPDLALPTYSQIRRWVADIRNDNVWNWSANQPYSDYAYLSPSLGGTGWNWSTDKRAGTVQIPHGFIEHPLPHASATYDRFADPDFYCAPSHNWGADLVSRIHEAASKTDYLLSGCYGEQVTLSPGQTLDEGSVVAGQDVLDQAQDLSDKEAIRPIGGEPNIMDEAMVGVVSPGTEGRPPNSPKDALYSPEDGLDMFYDMRREMISGRLLNAFPTFYLALVDGGRMLGIWRLFDHVYGLLAATKISVYRDRIQPVETAVVGLSNMYGLLTNYGFDDVLARQRDSRGAWQFAFWYELDRQIQNQIGVTDDTVSYWAEHVKSMVLKPGARLHIRLGYGSDATQLPVVFNGVISEVPLSEDEVRIVAVSDGVELTHDLAPTGMRGSIPAYTLTTAFGEGSIPREIFMKFMAPHAGTFHKTVAEAKEAFGNLFYTRFGNEYGIEHFGTPCLQFGQTGTGDIGLNIYHASFSIPYNTSSAWTNCLRTFKPFCWDENRTIVGINMMNATPWEIFQTVRRTVPGFLLSVQPVGFRSTLFFGKGWFPMYGWVREQLVPGGDPKDPATYVEWKPFQQVHLASSYWNLLTSSVRADATDVYTRCQAVGTYRGLWGKRDRMAMESSYVMQVDSDIYTEFQRTKVVDSGLYSTWGMLWHDSLTTFGAGTSAKEAMLRKQRGEIEGSFWDSTKLVISNTFGIMGGALVGAGRAVWDMGVRGVVRNFGGPPCSRRITDHYAASVLQDSVGTMYQGSIVQMGSGWIKPWDYLYLDDTFAAVSGPVRVKEVVHNLSLETGFTTEVTPECLTTYSDPDTDNLLLWVQMLAGHAAGILATAWLWGTTARWLDKRRITTNLENLWKWLRESRAGMKAEEIATEAGAKVAKEMEEARDFVRKELDAARSGEKSPLALVQKVIDSDSVKAVKDKIPGKLLTKIAIQDYLAQARALVTRGYGAAKNAVTTGGQAALRRVRTGYYEDLSPTNLQEKVIVDAQKRLESARAALEQAKDADAASFQRARRAVRQAEREVSRAAQRLEKVEKRLVRDAADSVGKPQWHGLSREDAAKAIEESIKAVEEEISQRKQWLEPLQRQLSSVSADSDAAAVIKETMAPGEKGIATAEKTAAELRSALKSVKTGAAVENAAAKAALGLEESAGGLASFGLFLVISGAVGSLADWMKRTAVARQCLTIYPLRRWGQNMVAGIDGHRGAVYGDPIGTADAMWEGYFGFCRSGFGAFLGFIPFIGDLIAVGTDNGGFSYQHGASSTDTTWKNPANLTAPTAE